MTMQTARYRALTSLGAIRWPYRVIAIESPSGMLTRSSHDSLLASGIDLRPYADGPSALLGLMAEDPAAVLAPTDLIGVDYLRLIRAIVAWSDIPVIIGLTNDEPLLVGDGVCRVIAGGGHVFAATRHLPRALPHRAQLRPGEVW